MITRALLVGINEYRVRSGRFPNLRGCVNDVHLVHEILSGSVLELQTLLNEDATTDAVLTALEECVSTSRPGDHIMFYYSGHGVRLPDVDRDESDGFDEALVTHDFDLTKPLLDDIVASLLSGIPSETTATVVIDCCHSGGLPKNSMTAQPRGVPPIPRSSLDADARAALLAHKRSYVTESVQRNFVALLACDAREQAWERVFDGKRHGVFTHSLCKALRERSEISASDAISVVASTMPQGPKQQTPRLIGRADLFNRPLLG